MRFARTVSVRAVSAALALGAATMLPAAPLRAETATFMDVICPNATQYVIAAGRVRVDDPPERIYAAAQAATDAYGLCSKEKLSHGYREAQHYADTRGASFGVVAARALIALQRFEEARRQLLRSREAAQQVVDWHFETEAYNSAYVNGFAVTIGADHNRPSMYRQSAREIVASADEALQELDRRDPIPRRQASPPRPEPTPVH